MKGWKTWTGVVGLVLTQVATVYLGVDMDLAGADATKILTLIQAIFGGLTVVGIGHKVEKSAGGLK